MNLIDAAAFHVNGKLAKRIMPLAEAREGRMAVTETAVSVLKTGDFCHISELLN